MNMPAKPLLRVLDDSSSRVSEPQYILFNASGIPDKEILATAVVSSIKDEYPEGKIIVLSRNPEVWIHNPQVYRVYRLGVTPYFYEDYIKDKNSRIFWQDPYGADDAIHRRKNLIEVWCELCGVTWNRKDPRLYFTFREYEATRRMLAQKLPLSPRQQLCAASLQQPLPQPVTTPKQTLHENK
jgi:hypothetical protein